jgi:hypothetical protein
MFRIAIVSDRPAEKSTCDRLIQQMKSTASHSLGLWGDRLCKCFTTGRAIALFRVQKVEESYSLYGYDWQVSEGD